MPYDSADMIRAAAAGNLVADETIPTNPGNQIDGTPVSGVTFRLHVPAFVAATTLLVKIQHSDDGTTWEDLLTFPLIDTAGEVGEHRRRLATSKKYIRAFFDITGAANFGAVQLGPDAGGEQSAW